MFRSILSLLEHPLPSHLTLSGKFALEAVFPIISFLRDSLRSLDLDCRSFSNHYYAPTIVLASCKRLTILNVRCAESGEMPLSTLPPNLDRLSLHYRQQGFIFQDLHIFLTKFALLPPVLRLHLPVESPQMEELSPLETFSTTWAKQRQQDRQFAIKCREICQMKGITTAPADLVGYWDIAHNDDNSASDFAEDPSMNMNVDL